MKENLHAVVGFLPCYAGTQAVKTDPTLVFRYPFISMVPRRGGYDIGEAPQLRGRSRLGECVFIRLGLERMMLSFFKEPYNAPKV